MYVYLNHPANIINSLNKSMLHFVDKNGVHASSTTNYKMSHLKVCKRQRKPLVFHIFIVSSKYSISRCFVNNFKGEVHIITVHIFAYAYVANMVYKNYLLLASGRLLYLYIL